MAFVGCDFDTAPRARSSSTCPGWMRSPPSASRIAAMPATSSPAKPSAPRGSWTRPSGPASLPSCACAGSSDPLDRTSLHPEQYQLARQLLESSGGSVSESLGRPGATKGLRRQSFDVDEFTWRDLMRELSFPGRDPRGRNHVPEYISESTDPIRLQPGRVITGVVTNVASFGAFVDVGKKQDAMIHISQLASRYIRDARELLSIGATIRAKIVDGNSSRLALSLKDVPNEERPERGARRRGAATRRRGGGPVERAARISRRDRRGASGAVTVPLEPPRPRGEGLGAGDRVAAGATKVASSAASGSIFARSMFSRTSSATTPSRNSSSRMTGRPRRRPSRRRRRAPRASGRKKDLRRDPRRVSSRAAIRCPIPSWRAHSRRRPRARIRPARSEQRGVSSAG